MTTFDGGAEDLHDEYQAAALKKAGLPEHLEVAEVSTEYGLRDLRGVEWWGYTNRAAAEEFAGDGDTIIVREALHTTAREATPRAQE